MRRKNSKRKSEDLNYWQSYSDMMAALLLVFVLIIAFTIMQAKSNYEEKQAELEQYEKQIATQQEQLDKIIGVRGDIIQELKTQFEGSDLDVTIDPDTGAISFDSSILFDFDQYTVKDSGAEFLDEFIPQYFNVILKDGINEYVAEVIIEGHTDQNGTYLYNLDLSQKRAFSVVEYCFNDNNRMFTDSELEKIRSIVTANGRAYYEPIYDENGVADADASRRVEVQFRLTEEEMIQEMSRLLEID